MPAPRRHRKRGHCRRAVAGAGRTSGGAGCAACAPAAGAAPAAWAGHAGLPISGPPQGGVKGGWGGGRLCICVRMFLSKLALDGLQGLATSGAPAGCRQLWAPPIPLDHQQHMPVPPSLPIQPPTLQTVLLLVLPPLLALAPPALRAAAQPPIAAAGCLATAKGGALLKQVRLPPLLLLLLPRPCSAAPLLLASLPGGGLLGRHARSSRHAQVDCLPPSTPLPLARRLLFLRPAIP